MGDRARSGGTEIDLAGVGAGMGDEILKRVDAERGVDDQDLRHAHREREQRKILAPVEWHLACHERNGRQRRCAGKTDRVAVGRAFSERVDASQAAGAGADLDHHLLAELGPKRIGQGAADKIGGAAGGERHDQPDRPVRKGLCPRGRRPQRRDGKRGYERASRNAHGSSYGPSYGSSYPVHRAILTQPPAKTTAILAARRHFQKLSAERTAITHAFGRKLPSLLRTPAPGRMMYCTSGCSIHHGANCAWYIISIMASPLRTGKKKLPKNPVSASRPRALSPTRAYAAATPTLSFGRS